MISNFMKDSIFLAQTENYPIRVLESGVIFVHRPIAEHKKHQTLQTDSIKARIAEDLSPNSTTYLALQHQHTHAEP